MYIVAQLYRNKEEKPGLMTEAIHNTMDEALTDYNDRIMRGYRELVIAKILTVRTVVIDYDEAGEVQSPLIGGLSVK